MPPEDEKLLAQRLFTLFAKGVPVSRIVCEGVAKEGKVEDYRTAFSGFKKGLPDDQIVIGGWTGRIALARGWYEEWLADQADHDERLQSTLNQLLESIDAMRSVDPVALLENRRAHTGVRFRGKAFEWFDRDGNVRLDVTRKRFYPLLAEHLSSASIGARIEELSTALARLREAVRAFEHKVLAKVGSLTMKKAMTPDGEKTTIRTDVREFFLVRLTLAASGQSNVSDLLEGKCTVSAVLGSSSDPKWEVAFQVDRVIVESEMLAREIAGAHMRLRAEIARWRETGALSSINTKVRDLIMGLKSDVDDPDHLRALVRQGTCRICKAL